MTFIREYKSYLTRAAIVWMASLVLCLLAYMILLRPQNNSKRQFESTLAEQKQLLASARRAAQEQTQIQLNEQIERLRHQLEDFVIDLESLSDLTYEVTQIANRENLASFNMTTRAKKKGGRRSITTKAKSETNHISENLIDINFTAGFRQFATFVNALERHRPVLLVDKFKIERSTKDESLYQASLDVATLVRKQQDNETAHKDMMSSLSAKL